MSVNLLLTHTSMPMHPLYTARFGTPLGTTRHSLSLSPLNHCLSDYIHTGSKTHGDFGVLGELSPLREAERRSGELAPKTNTWWRCCLLLPAGGGDYFVQTPRQFLASARTPPTSQYFSPKSPPADYITDLFSRRYCAHKTARWNKDGHFWWLAF